MNRRKFLRNTASLAVVAPFVAVSKLADIGKEKRAPMPPLQTGSVLTAEFMNDLVTRVNELEQQS